MDTVRPNWESKGNKSGYHEFTIILSYVVHIMYICTTLTFNFSKIKIPDFGVFGDFNETEAVTEQNITLGLAF